MLKSPLTLLTLLAAFLGWLSFPDAEGGELNGFTEIGQLKSLRKEELPSLRKVRPTNQPAKAIRTTREHGRIVRYLAGQILVKFRNDETPRLIQVAEGAEAEAIAALGQRGDIQFAELDRVFERQFAPNDPGMSLQWHHATLGSSTAWNYHRGHHSVKIAIVDTPFQMNHPDLAANTAPGWDIVFQRPITSDTNGFYHSTICAGLAAAVIDNQIGIAGLANCQILPININGSASEMYNAITWAADQGIRLVNVSWDGASIDTLQEAGRYLRQKCEGLLVMAGVNAQVYLTNYPNHPDIIAVSMTDRADKMRSALGPHIDFAAPGWQIYSTTTNSFYEFDSGTSYSAPLFCGAAAVLLAIHPTLTASEIFEIFKRTAVDLGAPGWDPEFGWGRIDFAKAAAAAFALLPESRLALLGKNSGNIELRTGWREGASYQLWRTSDLVNEPWTMAPNIFYQRQQTNLFLIDPAPSSPAFYKLQVTLP